MPQVFYFLVLQRTTIPSAGLLPRVGSGSKGGKESKEPALPPGPPERGKKRAHQHLLAPYHSQLSNPRTLPLTSAALLDWVQLTPCDDLG